eukprot:scaffold66992_cov53-Attheya_sp.AAC.1
MDACFGSSVKVVTLVLLLSSCIVFAVEHQDPTTLRLERLFAHDDDSWEHHQTSRRGLLNAATVECGAVLQTIATASDATDFITAYFGEQFADDAITLAFTLSLLRPLIRNGVQIRKVCSSCASQADSMNNTNSNQASYLEYCGPDVYGYDTLHSGLLLLPVSEGDGESIKEGTMSSFLFNHASESDSYGGAPSENWNQLDSSVDAVFGFLGAASGLATLLPDYMGYGESAEVLHKGYLLRKTYGTATLPLFLKMQSIIREETDCKSALAPAAVLAGYSEGGYSSVAIADALSSGLGVDIISVQSGAGPYKIGSVTLPKVMENMRAGTFPPSQYYLMLLIASSFSSTNPMVENYQLGQDLLADRRKAELLELVKRGGSNSEFNSFVNNDDPIDMFDANFTAWAFESIAAGNYDPCSFRLEEGFNDKLCEALASNDLTDILLNVNYPVQMCQSPDDEIVTALNIPNIEENDFLRLLTVTGNHNQAGGFCLIIYRLLLF